MWLDLANAYGSIPHELIETSLDHYHIQGHVKGLIKSYFGDIKLRFTVGNVTTRWQPLEKGIVTGCTLSVILFIIGMNLIIKAAKRETRGPITASGARLPANRSFMGDLTISTKSHIQARWILKVLDETVSWARMNFKPQKSRCMVIRKGQVTKKCPLLIQNEEIPSIVDKPIKCLGKWFDATLKDHNNVQRLKQQVEEDMRKIDKTGLPGKFNAWLYQHASPPRLTWPLMLYEIPTSRVKEIERTVSKYLRRWLGIPPSFTSIGLYGRTTRLQLPFSSLIEEFKVVKTRLVVTLRESKDQSVRIAGIETRTGRKWYTSQAVEQTESRLRHRDIVGATCEGRQGLGNITHRRWKDANQRERRELMQKEVRAAEEEAMQAKAVEMGIQGTWTKWVLPDRKLTWNDLWKFEPLRIEFLLRSVYDLLPSPANFCRWTLTDNLACPLCERRDTLDHILSSCNVALTQGRYTWMHNHVLREMADTLEHERKKKITRIKPETNPIAFVKEGQKTKQAM